MASIFTTWLCHTLFSCIKGTKVQTNTPKHTRKIADLHDCFILFSPGIDSRILRLEGCMHHLLLVPELPSPPALLQPVQEWGTNKQAFINIQRTNNNKEHVIETNLPCRLVTWLAIYSIHTYFMYRYIYIYIPRISTNYVTSIYPRIIYILLYSL